MRSSMSASNKEIIQRSPVSEAKLSGIHPVLDRIYRNRGVRHPSELDYSLKNLLPPNRLANLDDAVEIILDAVQADATILIAGDYDADGATSCALATLAFRAFGARHVGYVCPDRERFGYGLSKDFVDFLSDAEPDLLITVDNGISSIDGVRYAKELGMTVIVTDHHLPGDTLPEADAIINPRLPDDHFESKNLAGVGVIFYILTVVRSQLAKSGWFESQGIAVPNMADYLDLVALGTVADVVPLDKNNRILVAQGLKRINSDRCRFGVRALLESGGRQIGGIVASDLAFAAGPRLNAAGRLDDIRYGVESLISNNRDEILDLVEKMERFNLRRREQESTMVDQALHQVSQIEDNLETDKYSNCLKNEDWHSGIVGLIASRVREQTGRPTIAFAPDNQGRLRGSGRSIWNVNIRDAIAEVSNIHPDLIIQFGGHAMAAGLTITQDSFEEFSESFEDVVGKFLDHAPTHDRILTDGEAESLDLPTAEAILSGGPWGQGFEEPLFEGPFEVLDYQILKEIHLRMNVYSEKHSTRAEAIFFNYFNKHPDPPKFSTYRMVYQLQVNDFRGKQKVQLNVRHMQEL